MSGQSLVKLLCQPGVSGCIHAPKDAQRCEEDARAAGAWPSNASLHAAKRMLSMRAILLVGDSTLFNKARYLHEALGIRSSCAGGNGLCFAASYDHPCRPLGKSWRDSTPATQRADFDIVVWNAGLHLLETPNRPCVPGATRPGATTSRGVDLGECAVQLRNQFAGAVLIYSQTNWVCSQRFTGAWRVWAKQRAAGLNQPSHIPPQTACSPMLEGGVQAQRVLEANLSDTHGWTMLASPSGPGVCSCTGAGDGRHFVPLVPEWTIRLAGLISSSNSPHRKKPSARGMAQGNETCPPPRVIALGMPKSGSSSLATFLECSGLRTVHQYFSNFSNGVPSMTPLATIISENARNGSPLLQGLPRCVEAITQLDCTYARYCGCASSCSFPQLERLSQIVEDYRNATFVLHVRESASWLDSLHRWNRMDLRLFARCRAVPPELHHAATRLLNGAPNNSADAAIMRELVPRFYEMYTSTVRSVVAERAAQPLVEFDITRPDAGAYLASRIAGTRRECWQHANETLIGYNKNYAFHRHLR